MGRKLARHGRLAAGLVTVSILGACSGDFTASSGGSPARLADRAARAGDYNTAAALYQQAYDENPSSVDALIGLGRSYSGLGQYARAEQALAEAQRRRPNDPEVLLELARIQLGAGQAQAALASIEQGAAARAEQPAR